MATQRRPAGQADHASEVRACDLSAMTVQAVQEHGELAKSVQRSRTRPCGDPMPKGREEISGSRWLRREPPLATGGVRSAAERQATAGHAGSPPWLLIGRRSRHHASYWSAPVMYRFMSTKS